MSAIAVAAATAAVEKVRDGMGKQRERRERFEGESDDVLRRAANSGGTGCQCADGRDGVGATSQGGGRNPLNELRIIAASYSHSDVERERAAAILRRR